MTGSGEIGRSCSATDYDAGAGNQYGHIGGCPVHGPTVLEADEALRAEQSGRTEEEQP